MRSSDVAALRNLGETVRRLRTKQGISQEEFADRCDFHRTYVSDVERGTRNLSFSTLLAVARGLGLTVSELTLGVQVNAPEPRV
jgi:transcriptional regulator with XRE-family HTH domain